MSGFVVAIDGPAGAGKSTTARLAASRLGFLYLDTGAMYRALTWKALDGDLDLADADALGRLAAETRLDLVERGERVLVDGHDVTEAIRDPAISRRVSEVAQVPAVRRAMVRLQREAAAGARVVVEGRDIGTVVFPAADVKIYLEASLAERARRRREELAGRGVSQSLAELEEEIRRRDAIDSGRADSPLRRADDAFPLDTTGLSVEDQVDAVVRRVLAVLAGREEGAEGSDPGRGSGR